MSALRPLAHLIVMLAAVAASVLAMSGTATASHSTYWFFQGNLPTADGTYTVHHEAICCYEFLIVRMSWEPSTHDMNFIFIHRNGSWHGQTAEYWDPDQEAVVPTSDYARGGCQNPPDWNWWTVYTNCHVRGL